MKFFYYCAKPIRVIVKKFLFATLLYNFSILKDKENLFERFLFEFTYQKKEKSSTINQDA